MYNNDYMYAIERNDEYLAHYGIRGMKWGVRKAIASGNSARLGRQYAKAQKKLAKLEKQAGKSKKYARRAALMGAGAAAAGGLAAAGTVEVARGIAKGGGALADASRGIGDGLKSVGTAIGAYGRTPGKSNFLKNASTSISANLNSAGNAMNRAGAIGKGGKGVGGIIKGAADASGAVYKWGNSNSIGNALAERVGKMNTRLVGANTRANVNQALKGVSNNTIARIGAGAVGAGLAAGAARNAYKAATAKKKAEKFRAAMNESFKGTQYANKTGGNSGNRQGGKKRRRR